MAQSELSHKRSLRAVRMGLQVRDRCKGNTFPWSF